MNSQSQYIRELGQEEIKSNKFKCKSKATDEFDSQRVIHDNKPRKSLLWQWFGYQRQLLYNFVNYKHWISSKLLVCERSYTFFVLNSTQCFIQYPESSKWVLQNLAALFFQTTSRCQNITWNTLSCVWYWYFCWDDIGWNLCFIFDIITCIVSNLEGLSPECKLKAIYWKVRCAVLSPLTIGYTPEQHRFISALKSSKKKTS